MSRPHLPRWLWWLLLGAAVAGILVASSAGNDSATPAKAQTARAARPESRLPAPAGAAKKTPGPGRVELERLAPPPAKPADSVVSNVFGATSWYVPPPPPPPPPPAPPPKPTAPPMPFAYLGSYDADAKLIIVLAKGDRVYTVSPGDVIEGTYRIESIKGPWLEMIYLPLNIKQTINTGGA